MCAPRQDRIVRVAGRADLDQQGAVAYQVVAAHPDVVGGGVPGQLGREGRVGRGGQVGGYARWSGIAAGPEPAGGEGGVVEDHVPGAAGRVITHLEHPHGGGPEVGAAEGEVGHRHAVKPDLDNTRGDVQVQLERVPARPGGDSAGRAAEQRVAPEPELSLGRHV